MVDAVTPVVVPARETCLALPRFEANRQASLQVTAEMLRVLRGEHPEVLANPEVWPRPAHRR